jgi:hypothetical protein
MIAVRMLPREEYQQYLRPFGCNLLIECEILEDGIYGWTYWRTSWGFYFHVPEINHMCPHHIFFAILSEVSRQAPRP